MAIAADGKHVAVVQEAIEDRGRDHGVAEHRAPLADVAVRRDEHRALLAAPRHELEKQVGGAGRERLIAEFSMPCDTVFPRPRVGGDLMAEPEFGDDGVSIVQTTALHLCAPLITLCRF
jgi:hypothetical protein